MGRVPAGASVAGARLLCKYRLGRFQELQCPPLADSLAQCAILPILARDRRLAFLPVLKLVRTAAEPSGRVEPK